MARGRSGKPRIPVFSRKAYNADQITAELANINLGSTDVPIGSGPWLKFEDMNLNPDLLKGIYAYGHETPAPIQQRAIVPCISGRDLVLQAQSGMGKTAALCIGILQRMNLDDHQNCQALVLAPTRELAIQICEVFCEFSKFMNIKCMSTTGGTRLFKDKEKLSGGGISVIVGTLGRILHLIDEKFLLMDTVRMFAMDEADMMLTDRSITRDLCKLVGQHIEAEAQIILMSATMPQLAVDRAKEFMKNPQFFMVNNEELTLEGIRQYHVNVEDEERKIETLFDLKAVIAEEFSVIFCSTRKRVKSLTEKLNKRGDPEKLNERGDMDKLKERDIFSSICGDMEQGDRDNALKEFRTGKTRLIITSDLLGRGIDVHKVSLVINYDLPTTMEGYIHRVGRGGRFGRKGIALTFVTNDQMEELKKIAEFYSTEIPPMPCNIFK